MASCYGSVISNVNEDVAKELSYLPIKTNLLDGTCVEIDFFRERCDSQ